MLKSWLAAAAFLGICVGSVSAQTVNEAFLPFLNASDLRDLETDAAGNIWIGSNGGALRFDPAAETWSAFPRRRVGGPVGNDIVTVAVDASGKVWAGSADLGISWYDPATERWERFEEIPDSRIRVVRAPGNWVLIGTQAGLALRTQPNRTEICNDIDRGCIVPSFQVNDYARMGDTLWVATVEGLGRFNGVSWDSASALPSGSVGTESRSLAVFEGVLWEARPGAVRRLVDGAWESFPTAVTALVASGGKLHLLREGGVAEWNGSGFETLGIPLQSLGPVRDLVVDGDTYFLATGAGLARWTRGASSLDAVYVPPGPQVPDFHRGITADGNGTVWVGNTQGLMAYDGESWQFFPLGVDDLEGDWIWGLLVDGADDLWVAHCCCPDPPSCRTTLRRDGVNTRFPDFRNGYGFALDSRGRIWMATDTDGVFVLENQGGTWTERLHLTTESTGGALATNTIRAVAVTEEGTYFGNLITQGVAFWPHGGDLTRGADGSTWSKITAGNGLFDGNVSSMTSVGRDVYVGTTTALHLMSFGAVTAAWSTRNRSIPGDLPRIARTVVADRLGGVWVGTNRGLLHLKRGSTEFNFFTTDNSDLTDNDVLSSTMNPVDGSLWFGTVSGITRVDPQILQGVPPQADAYIIYPNPFRFGEGASRVTLGFAVAGTNIQEALLQAGSPVEIFELTGAKVGDFRKQGSEWRWDMRNINGDFVVPGLYLVRATAANGEAIELKLGVVR